MTRGRWQGMLAIARFNWPFYVAAALVFFGGIAVFFIAANLWVLVFVAVAVVGSGYFIFVSLGVSHLIYDRSDLYHWDWLERAMRRTAGEHMIFCHSGFDESSVNLAAEVGDAEWMLLDHYDPVTMTEASIKRARMLYPPAPGTVCARYDEWPIADGWADVVFGILAIHELRTVEERGKWFSEAKRSLRVGGRVVIVEHVRDAANFLAFGPGFLHFHSMKNWRLSWQRAGLRLVDDFRITPWVRVFLIENP